MRVQKKWIRVISRLFCMLVGCYALILPGCTFASSKTESGSTATVSDGNIGGIRTPIGTIYFGGLPEHLDPDVPKNDTTTRKTQ